MSECERWAPAESTSADSFAAGESTCFPHQFTHWAALESWFVWNQWRFGCWFQWTEVRCPDWTFSFLGNFSLFWGFDTEHSKLLASGSVGLLSSYSLGSRDLWRATRCAHEMESWAVFPNRACHLHKSFVASGSPLGVPPGTGLSAGEAVVAGPRVVSDVSWLVRSQHPVLPTQSEAPEHLKPWEPPPVEADHPHFSRAKQNICPSLLFVFSPRVLSHSFLEAVW